tara:strand:- start:1038 stop:2246 length:1209 start_codon:yes stop_codon:yes gene_type:complete
MSKRILIVSRYFWPDKTPESKILYTLAFYLKKKGHIVDVLSSQPSYRKNYENLKRPYKEIDKGVKIFRINLSNEIGKIFLFRIINSIKLSLKTIYLSLINRYEIIIATSNPPVIGPFSAATSALLINSRFIYYCMDITPEVGLVSKDFSNPYLYNLLQIIDGASCLLANPLIVHSSDMKNTILKRSFGKKCAFEILNNFSPKSKSKVILDKTFFSKNDNKKLSLIYAGNIGRFQSLEGVIEEMSKIKNYKNIELTIMGEGFEKENLIKLNNKRKANVKFIPYQNSEVAKNIISQADIGLISLSKNVYKYSYPSKTMTYLELGKPIIAIVEKEAQLANDINEGNFGYVVSDNIKNSLADLLIYLAENQEEIYLKSVNALKIYEKLYSEEVILKKWESIIDKWN